MAVAGAGVVPLNCGSRDGGSSSLRKAICPAKPTPSTMNCHRPCGPSEQELIMSLQTTHFRFALARYTSPGDLDNTFSSDGRVVTDFPLNPDAVASGLPTDAAGKLATGSLQGIVVAGWADAGFKFALVRYTSSGDLDNTFAGDGRLTTSIPSVESSSARAVAIDASGRIVVAGWGHAPVDNENRFAVARYTTTGGQDNSFAGDGTLTTTFPGAMSATGFAMAIDAHGRIVVAGSANVGGNDRFAVARYTSSGDLDHSFAGDGR